jgi:hypothetical protein
LSNASGSIAGFSPSIKFFVNREDMGQTINLIELLSTTHRSEATIGDLNECFADRAVRLYWARKPRCLRPLLWRDIGKMMLGTVRRLFGL